MSEPPTIIEHVFDSVATPAAVVYDAADLDELLVGLLSDRPGSWMCAVLDELRGRLTTPLQHEKYLQCWERLMPWLQLRRAEAVAAAADCQERIEGPLGVDDFGADVVALITGQTKTTATNDVVTARSLIRELPGCYSALDRGDITWQMARAVVEATGELPPWERTQVDQAMVKSWEISNDITAWRRKLRREVMKVSAETEERRRAAAAQRSVQTWPLPDGMAAVFAKLRAEDAGVVMAALSAIADRYAQADREAAQAAGAGPAATDESAGVADEWISPEEFAALPTSPPYRRSLDQRRADALVDLCDDVLADGTLPTRHGRRPVIQATGGILTLLGLADHPGQLAGYGPITAQHLRELAADAEWYRFLTAPDTGALIATGSATYRPNRALRDFLLAAHPQCDFPGCPVAASRCDLDHSVEFDRGGPTDQHNCRPRCRRHHRCKTHSGWQVEVFPDGSVAWTTPAGTTRLVPPPRLAADAADDEPG